MVVSIETCLKQMVLQQHTSKNYAQIVVRFVMGFPLLRWKAFEKFVMSAEQRDRMDYLHAFGKICENW